MNYRIVEDYSGFNEPIAYATEAGIIELCKKVYETRKEEAEELGLVIPKNTEAAIKFLNEMGYTVEGSDIEWGNGYLIIEERG